MQLYTYMVIYVNGITSYAKYPNKMGNFAEDFLKFHT